MCAGSSTTCSAAPAARASFTSGASTARWDRTLPPATSTPPSGWGAAASCPLVQELAAARRPGRLPLWLVTRGAQPAGGVARRPTTLTAATVWGMGRTLAVEHADLWGGLVDLDPAAPAEDAAALLGRPAPGGRRRGPGGVPRRRAPRRPADPHPGRGRRRAPTRWRAGRELPGHRRPRRSRTAGGALDGRAGSAAPRAARALRAAAARRVECGRPGEPGRPPRSRAVRALEALGASVHLAAVDVADEAGAPRVPRDLPARRLAAHPRGRARGR